MSEIIVKVCTMPRDFRKHRHKNMNQLFKESGYLEQPAAVTKQKLYRSSDSKPRLD